MADPQVLVITHLAALADYVEESEAGARRVLDRVSPERRDSFQGVRTYFVAQAHNGRILLRDAFAEMAEKARELLS